jgi:PAS domain S-box-containing protein
VLAVITLGEKKAASGDPETKVKQMLRKILDMQESDCNVAQMPSLLDGLKENLDDLLACLQEPSFSLAEKENPGRMNSPFDDCLFFQDRDLRYTWFSSEKPLGIEASMVLGKTENESQICPPSEARRLREIKEQVMKTGKRAQTEVCLTLQGRVRSFDCIYYPWLDEFGKILGLTGYVRDATFQKEAEIEILKMTRAVETAPTAIVLTDLEGKIEYVNASLLKNSGFRDVSEVKGLSIFDFTNAEGKAKLQEEIIPSLHSVGQWQGELPLKWLDGQSVMVEMICALVKDDCGKPIYLLANFYNITDRKHAEEALLLDDSRLEALQRLNQMDEASIKEIADFALEAGIKLTGSKLGYLAFVDEEEKTLFMHSWSKKAMQECDIEHKRIVYPLQETGLWGEAIRQRKAVITNDYASCPHKRGTPAGHVKVVRHMNVPIMDKGKVVIVAGLGNKVEEYDDSDVRQLTLLMSGMWKIIQRRSAEEALRESQRALSTLMSNLPGMAYRCKNDRQWTMEFVSDGCLELTGFIPMTKIMSGMRFRRQLQREGLSV